MALPRLSVRLDLVRQNADTVRELCAGYGIGVTGVTKGFTGVPEIAEAMLSGGIRRLGDSRLENLRKLSGLDAEKWLIRLPALSEAEEAVRLADVSLNSEWRVIRALDAAAERAGKTHKIILMADLGDLREGYAEEKELLETAEKTAGLRHVRLYGVGTNLGCFCFVHPDRRKMEELCGLAERLPITEAPVVSGGNSASLRLMAEGGIPAGVNNLRLGESLLFGRERCGYTYLPRTRRDAFLLSAEIIELKEKPSAPWGEIGKDSYGRYPAPPKNRGIRKRAILALGRQDCDPETMRPIDPAITILGASSDHMILDVTDSGIDYRVGDQISFELGYFSLLRACTSAYVEKRYLAGMENYADVGDRKRTAAGF